MFNVGVKFEHVPGWVWAALVVAVFFFGILLAVPEARHAFGSLFTRPAGSIPQTRGDCPNEFEKWFFGTEEAIKRCQISN